MFLCFDDLNVSRFHIVYYYFGIIFYLNQVLMLRLELHFGVFLDLAQVVHHFFYKVQIFLVLVYHLLLEFSLMLELNRILVYRGELLLLLVILVVSL